MGPWDRQVRQVGWWMRQVGQVEWFRWNRVGWHRSDRWNGTGWDGTGGMAQVGQVAQVAQGGTTASPSQGWTLPPTSPAPAPLQAQPPPGAADAPAWWDLRSPRWDELLGCLRPWGRAPPAPSLTWLWSLGHAGVWGELCGVWTPRCPGMGMQRPWEGAGSPGDAQGCRNCRAQGSHQHGAVWGTVLSPFPELGWQEWS